jgi:hypothetical protein
LNLSNLNQFAGGDHAIMVGTFLRHQRSQGAMSLLTDPTLQMLLLLAIAGGFLL